MILVPALGTAFIAIYRGTGTQLRAQIDQDLRREATAFAQTIPLLESRAHASEGRPSCIEDQVTSTVAPRLYVVRVSGGGIVTNQPELNPADSPGVAGPHRESPEARALRTAPLGFSDVTVGGEQVRLYAMQALRDGRRSR